MAKLIGVSRRTLYGYERGMAKASVSVAYNLIHALGAPVAKPVNVFEKSKAKHECAFLSTARRVLAENKLLMRIFSGAERYKVTTVKKAPFDFVITVPELRSAGFTTLAVIDPQMHPSDELHAIIGLFEGEINLYEKETEKGSEKLLKIKKMAIQRYLKDELLLKEEDSQK